MLVIVSKEFVGYLLAAIGPIALGKIYDVCHSWTMPLVLLQAGDTVVFKDLYRFTREAENGYKKYMEWLSITNIFSMIKRTKNTRRITNAFNNTHITNYSK